MPLCLCPFVPSVLKLLYWTFPISWRIIFFNYERGGGNLTRIFIDIPFALLSFRVCHQMSISKSDPVHLLFTCSLAVHLLFTVQSVQLFTG